MTVAISATIIQLLSWKNHLYAWLL